MSYFVRLSFLLGILLSSEFLNAAIQTPYDTEPTPSIKRIVINGDSAIFISDSAKSQPGGLRKNITLSYRNNNIRIEVQPSDSINYQFFLEGFDKKWSSWTFVNFKEYTNIPAGKYL